METALAARPRQKDRAQLVTALRILIVSARFPPANTMGSMTVQNMAESFLRLGHEVAVLTMSHGPYSDMSLEINDSLEVWRTRLYMPARLLPGVSSGSTVSSGNRIGYRRSLLSKSRNALVPDPYIAWAAPAALLARKHARQWAPDIVIASGPPHSSLLLGRRIAGYCGARFIVQMRDLWLDNPYIHYGPLTRHINERMERRVLGSAHAVMVTSSSAATRISAKYDDGRTDVYRPYAYLQDAVLPVSSADVGVSVVHAGALYEGKRDPTKLINELNRLIKPERPVTLTFVGDAPEPTTELRTGLSVVAIGKVDRREALARVAGADIALILLWEQEPDAHTIPGKLYEAIAMRRSVLVLGRESAELEQLLADAGITGCVTTSPEIAARFIVEHKRDLAQTTEANEDTDQLSEQASKLLDTWMNLQER